MPQWHTHLTASIGAVLGENPGMGVLLEIGYLCQKPHFYAFFVRETPRGLLRVTSYFPQLAICVPVQNGGKKQSLHFSMPAACEFHETFLRCLSDLHILDNTRGCGLLLFVLHVRASETFYVKFISTLCCIVFRKCIFNERLYQLFICWRNLCWVFPWRTVLSYLHVWCDTKWTIYFKTFQQSRIKYDRVVSTYRWM